MKKIFLITLNFIIFSLFLSCENSLNTMDKGTDEVTPASYKEYQFFDKKCPIALNTPIWKAQLDKFIQNDSLCLESNFKISNYEYVKLIDSEEELENIKSDIVKENQYFPILKEKRKNILGKSSLNKQEFKHFLDIIMPSTIDQKETISNEKLINRYLFEKNDLVLININWINYGEKIKTKCLASQKKGIIFDEFLNYISIIIEKGQLLKRFKKVRLKTTTDENNPTCNGSVSKEFVTGISATNLVGWTLYDIRITCTDRGTCSNGVKTMTSYDNFNAYHTALFPYKTAAAIRSINFVIGKQGYHQFAWGYEYAFGASVSVTYSGTGFTLSGGGTGTAGEQYVRAADLY